MFPIVDCRERGLLVTLDQAQAVFFELAKQFAGQSKEGTATLWQQAEAQLTTGPSVFARCGQRVRLFLHEAEDADVDGLFVGHRLSIYTHGDVFLFKIAHRYCDHPEIQMAATLGLERAVEWFSLKFSLPQFGDHMYRFNHDAVFAALASRQLEWTQSLGERFEGPLDELTKDLRNEPQFVQLDEELQVTLSVETPNRGWLEPGTLSVVRLPTHLPVAEEPCLFIKVARANEDPSPMPLMLDNEARRMAACKLNALLAQPLAAALAL